MRSRSQPLPFLIPGDGQPAGSGASSGTRGGCLARLQRKNPEDKLRRPGQDRGGPAGGGHARSKGPRRAGPRPFPDLTAAQCRGAGGPHSPWPTPGETLLHEPPLLRPSQVRSERAPGRAAAVFARVGSLQCRKGQGAPRVPGSDGRTAQRARRRPPSATRPRRRFPRARFGGGAARCAPIGPREA